MATTYEDILNLFREVAEAQKETERKFQETWNRIYGAMAWLSADASAKAMVIKRGLFSIRATGDSASIQNDPAFTPHAW